MALLRCWIDERGLASLGEVGPSDHQGELGERRGENQPGTYIDPEFVVSSPVGTEDVWVPRMSSKYLDQDFPGMAQQDETGPWPYRFSTSPSPGFSSWCA